MNDKYDCECCGGTFTKGWTDEERDAEYARNRGVYDLGAKDESNYDYDDKAIVCDNCFKKITAHFNLPVL